MNFQKLAKNKMYILGDDDLTKPKRQTFKVNGQKDEIDAGQYKVYTLEPGEETKVSKGGITGMAVWSRHDNGPRFYSFTGLGIAGGGVGVSSNGGTGVAVGVTTGRIFPVDPNTALLLMKIYKEKK